MQTLSYPFPVEFHQDRLAELAETVRSGGIIIYPTETYYAIGGNALNPHLCRRLAALKNRDPGKPFPVIANSAAAREKLVDSWSDRARELAARYWPGALTMILPGRKEVPEEIRDGRGGIALRRSGHPLLEELAQICDLPLVATSANFRDQPPTAYAAELDPELFAKVDLAVLDDRRPPVPGHKIQPSTIVDFMLTPPRLVRPGAVRVPEIEAWKLNPGTRDFFLARNDLKLAAPGSARPRAVALFSHGLDSILAIKIIQQQDIRVRAVKFITPFFGWDIKGREREYSEEIKKLYDIDLTVVDLTRDYLKMLAAPPNGYGKNFNPCIDCKIMMLKRARELAEKTGADFLVTGEVVGQRPFSQRRDTMNRISRLSDTREMLLRPLCAKLLPLTRAEESGIVDREKLYDFSGRGRKPQMALATELGISEYPSPAGGCLLTDPGFGQRIRTLYKNGTPTPAAINLLKYGRFYKLEGGAFVIVGRHRSDNQELLKTADENCSVLHLAEMPGPVTVLWGTEGELHAAARLLVRHSKAKELEKVRINWRRGHRSGNLTWPLQPAPSDNPQAAS